MNEYINKIQSYYDNEDEENRLCDPRKRIEYTNTCKYIEKYIQPNSVVLDCAAGTGAYIDFLHTLNCNKLIVSDLSSENTEKIKNVYANIPNIEIYQDNAMELTRHDDNKFDFILCLGPMYHLKPKESLVCLKELLRVAKPGCIIMIAYMNRHFMFWNLLNNTHYNICLDDLIFMSENGFLPGEQKKFLGCSYFSSPEEMETLVSATDCKIIDHVSIDLELGYFYSKLAATSDEDFKKIESYIYEKSKNKTLLGASKHNILILKK